MTSKKRKPGLLMTANWDSNVGYAWWLMESYWVTLAEMYSPAMTPIVAYPSISTLPEAIEQSSIQTVTMDFSRLGLKHLLKQLRFIRENAVEVIYFSDKPVRSWVYPFFRVAGVKSIVVHDHTPGTRIAPTDLKRLVKTLLNRLPGYTADVCIGATEFVRERFVQVACVPSSKCYSAPNGIPLELPEPRDIHSTFDIPKSRQIIVTTARANRYKGAPFALEALANVKKQYPDIDWHYVYMGDGPHREEFLQLADQLRIGDRVTFPGRVEGVTALFPGASFAFHPSQGEVGYSLSILEYMLAGLPVVVPDNPSVCGATDSGKTGVVYREGDVSSAADALALYLRSPEVTMDQGRAAAETVHNHFSLEKTHQQLRNIFATSVRSEETHGAT